MKGGRGAAGTPHDIALARARAEAGTAATSVPSIFPLSYSIILSTEQ